MRNFQFLTICFLILIIAIVGQQATENTDAGKSQKYDAFKHPLTDMPSSAEDVATSYFLPNHADLKLPIGEVVTTLCHFTNKGNGYYNISAIMGSLNAPFDFRHHFQNYSYKPIGMVIKNDEEITLQYSFQLHPDLEPVDYQLAITVFYESETEGFSTTFFNQTVELYLPTSEYDFETISSVLYSLVSTVLVVVISLYACFPESKISQKIGKGLKKVIPSAFSSPVVIAEGNDSEDDGWTVVQNKKNKKQKEQSEDSN